MAIVAVEELAEARIELKHEQFTVAQMMDQLRKELLASEEPVRLVAFFEACQELVTESRTVVIVASTYAFDDTTLARLRSMCDAHFTLRTEEVGEQIVKILEVAKVRGASKTTGNIITFDVEPGIGIKIIPISKASA